LDLDVRFAQLDIRPSMALRCLYNILPSLETVLMLPIVYKELLLHSPARGVPSTIEVLFRSVRLCPCFRPQY